MTAPGQQPGRDDEHRTWDELAVGWGLHALEPEDETLFAAHLHTCDRCRQTVADTSEVMAALAGDLPGAEPSDALRDRLRAAVEETEQVRPAALPEPPAAQPPVQRPAPVPLGGATAYGNFRAPLPAPHAESRPAWRRVLPTALVAAAVAAVLALGAWNVVVTGDRDAARTTAAEQSRVIESLLQPGRAAIAPLTENGQVVATVVARDGQVQVLAEGLSVNDGANQTYVVWGMRDGSPVAIGTFDVVTPEMDLRTVGSQATGLDDYSTYAISIEPGRQAPTTPSEIVATGQVTS
ncbi:anti-sigma factor [Modestobacter sp. VKM Ac-2986]|uniref:anti-sigma factor domain-containing protein n=1 Tax=Modestobacter sp. VKM Ac-2986 TaxID=3004140 RepID=UPI0022AACC01|nr:anti-sigma factor [Modestobacter sp. VKM Ac-2986]MCZ2828214.1 anti-sigma factor [Modestobacter sp. VKM Ac-2986]